MAKEVETVEAETTQEQNTDAQAVDTQDTNDQGKTFTESEYQKAVEEATKEASNKAKRELSKTLGVNLFDETETKTWLDGLSNKVDKSELDKFQDYDTIKQERDNVAFDNVIIKNGVKEEHQDKVKRLAQDEVANNELSQEEAVKKVLNDFPMFKGTRKAGIDLNDDNSTLTENERYIRDNYVMENGKPVRRK